MSSALPLTQRLPIYLRLMRVDRPIGTLLLLWPTFWALWIAAEGLPSLKLLVIFAVGTWLMRAAGCVINDYADRDFDAHVKRTTSRPFARGEVSEREALFLAAALALTAFVLVLFTNPLTIRLSFIAVALAFCYPFVKRYSHLPQLVLGAAFSWGIPMAFAAERGTVPMEGWVLYIGVVVWTVVYDTFYAMVDRDDDLKIGIKSTAVLFGRHDRLITAILQIITLGLLFMAGQLFELGLGYYLGLGVAAGWFVWQQYLIRHRDRDACFKAFISSHWAQLAILVGLWLDYHWTVPPL